MDNCEVTIRLARRRRMPVDTYILAALRQARRGAR